ncbi:MAG: hypothetical protein AAFO74_13125 [Pseudomonadota bacterium]
MSQLDLDELDAAIWAFVNGYDLVYPEDRKPGTVQAYDSNNGLYESIGFVDPGERQSNFRCHSKLVKDYTTSLDAALALTEEVLPTAGFMIETVKRSDDTRMGWSASLSANYKTPHLDAVHKSAPIALLICLLRALQAGGRSDA